MSRPVLRFTATHGGSLVAHLVGLLSRTWRVESSGNDHIRTLRSEGRGIVFCFWHGRMLELAWRHARDGVGVLVSSHADGVMASRIIGPLGYVPIRGSRRRNPVAGFRAMLRHAEAGGDLALTPDAHSDAHAVLPGAVALARLTGHALVPVAAAARPRRRVVSWDRFEIPWPWARVRIRYGAPIRIPATADDATSHWASRELEIQLNALHAELEAEFEEQPRRAARRSRVSLPG